MVLVSTFRSRIRRLTKVGLVVISIATSLCGAANAEIIYSDGFTGGAVTLDGVTVGTSSGTLGGTANATWLAGTPFFADGTVTNSTRSLALLAFTPQLGQIYELSGTISFAAPATGSVGFMGIGFANNLTFTNATLTTNNNSRLINNNASTALNVGMMFINGNFPTTPGTNASYSAYDGTTSASATAASPILGASNADVGPKASSYDIAIRLDTLTDATNWGLKYYIGGIEKTSATINAVTLGATIDSVGLNIGNPIGGSFSNFRLQTVTVPEPSSLALLGICGVGGVIIRSRKKNV